LKLTPTGWRRLALGLALVFAALNTANALSKGGDAAVFFEGGRRFLNRLPLYEGSSAAAGFIGPPFQAMFFAPFAAIGAASATAAKLAWYGLNLAGLFVAIRWTLQAWDITRRRLGLTPRTWLPGVFAPLGAILLPLQTNFEHQNMNALLLALLAGTTMTLTLGAPIVAGVFVGAATALKVFPGLLILYFAARRHWSAFVSAVTTTAVLTLLPAMFYGWSAFEQLARTFWRLGSSGWPVRGNNQSLVAAFDRWLGASDATGVHTMADSPIAFGLFVIVAALLVAAAFPLVQASRNDPTVPHELAAITTLGVLLSPVAWDHYWVLMFPAFLIVYHSQGPMARRAFWVAALLATGLSPLTLGRSGFNLARDLSVNTIAGLILYGSVLFSVSQTRPSTAQSRRTRTVQSRP
jgi:alpha-1,2-mannosyltransferase